MKLKNINDLLPEKYWGIDAECEEGRIWNAA